MSGRETAPAPATSPRRVLLTVLPALLLAACATPPDGPEAPVLAGRMALSVQATSTSPARSFSADFDLRGTSVRGRLRLAGPLGATLAEVRWEPGQAELNDAQGSRQYSSLDAMSADLFGEAVPLSALPDWLRGRPWPDAPVRGQDTTGFEQLEWRVGLTRFDLGIVEARRDRAPAIVLRARMESPS